MKIIKIGIIGISDENDHNISGGSGGYGGFVFTMVTCMQNLARKKYGNDVVFELVFGLTDVGINQCIHYHATDSRNPFGAVKTIGFGYSNMSFSKCLSVDEKYIIGTECGDESEAFVDYIDMLLKIGGGDKEAKEWVMFTTKYPDKMCYDTSHML
jgi:hypothetical protein